MTYWIERVSHRVCIVSYKASSSFLLYGKEAAQNGDQEDRSSDSESWILIQCVKEDVECVVIFT